MKKLFISSIVLFFVFRMDAQSRINKPLFQFITIERDTIYIFKNEIKLHDNSGFQITDSPKLAFLKKAVIYQAFFYENRKKLKLDFQYIFSSSVPENNLYIYTARENDDFKIRFSNDLVITCSEDLVRKIKASLELKQNKK